MAYRTTSVRTIVADDSSLDQVDYDRDSTIWQTKDLQVIHPTIRIAPGAAEGPVSLGAITQGYFVDIRSDYPIMLRLNGVSATQFTMATNNTAPTNLGAPLPDQCVFIATVKLTSLYLAPIAGATQTANVRICITADPLNAYT